MSSETMTAEVATGVMTSQVTTALALGGLILLSVGSVVVYFNISDSESNIENEGWVWIDPVVEIEDANHSHNNLSQHRLKTPNVHLIDYHNLNCDGNVKPPAELDDVAGRPCSDDYKNIGPTPGDNSEVSIEGNFGEDCVITADSSSPSGVIGGCYAYVSSYNQFEILDISKPNNIRLLSTYYAETARMIDIKVTPDNNWVLVNHELTNSELDPIPNDDDANSGANRLDVIYVGDKSSPVKVAEWNNPPAGFHNQDLHVYCDWEGAVSPEEECSLFLFGADPYPEMIEGDSGVYYKGTQVFYVPLGLESWLNPLQNDEQENTSRQIIRWGGYSPEPDTTCGGSIFNHDNVFHVHPITGQKLLYVSYWGAGLRIVDVTNPPVIPDPEGISWPQDYEVGRWLGCPTDDSGWYGPEGGGHAGMTPDEWLDAEQGNDNIHYAVPYDHLICNGIYEGDPKSEWPENCGTGPEDPEFGINWRHFTIIAPEYGENQNHTGWVWTIDTTDPAKPFLVSKWKLPGTGMKGDGSHPQHWIPDGYIFSPHNGDTGLRGHVYWTHYHAGIWLTDHGKIWEELVWVNGTPQPEIGFPAIKELAETKTLGYYLPAGPEWMNQSGIDALEYDMADCWASCMIPFDWGLQFDPRGFVVISEMVSGIYIVQFDEDKDARYNYPALWVAADEE